ncbi:transposase family protein [Streptomyces sp. NPDC086147]|uniref:transposase family protein n=1 Tax=Streptomyces sp. NPDC086147 TaxID=3155295 RepID=UPI00344D8EBD
MDRSTITRAIGEVRPLLVERGCTISSGIRLRTLAEVINHLGASEQTRIIDGTGIRVRCPAAGRKHRDAFISGKNKQNAVKTMVLTDQNGRVLVSSPATPGSCADVTHARQLGLVRLLADGPAVKILADAGYQGLGAQTGGRVVTPPHRTDRPHPDGPSANLYRVRISRAGNRAEHHLPVPERARDLTVLVVGERVTNVL